MFDIEYSNEASDFLKKADKSIAVMIINRIEKLKENPTSQDLKVIKGYRENLFRVRAGKYRILYEIDNINNKIGIVKIDKREKVYD